MNKNVILSRSTMRGVRKCRSCGNYNGNRARGCANEKCSLHYLKKGPDRRKPLIDAVQLISHNDTKIYSVRVKDRDPCQRNFVQIIDITLTADQDGSIVSRNAICFVDTCKYDSTDLNISCKHVKSASECSKRALEVKIAREVLYGMNISEGLKNTLWSQYTEHEGSIPAVQRVNKSTFVVKCTPSASQAAGRLHATLAPDDASEFTFACGCKKLRIMLSPNNSILLENATCDHLILILAGLLSCEQLRKDYQKFMNAMHGLWLERADKTDEHMLKSNEDFISFSENILNSCIEFTSSENISDHTIFSTEPTMQMKIASNSIEDEEIQLVNEPMSSAANEISNGFETTNLELAECQIELMDQFKLTNQIDLCNDDIQLCESDLFAENHVVCKVDGIIQDVRTDADDNACDMIAESWSNSHSKEISEAWNGKEKHSVSHPGEKVLSSVLKPSLEFDSWLNYIIERINSCVDFNAETETVVQSFDVSHDFFGYFSRKFSIGEKRRIPNSTTLIKRGKHKGLVKSTWIFTTTTTIKRIFSTDESCIEMERVFMEKSPGCFVPYVHEKVATTNTASQHKQFKRILPSMFKAFIQFGTKSKSLTEGFVIEWIPNVLTKSNFGVMNIQLNLGFKKNNKIIERFPKIS